MNQPDYSVQLAEDLLTHLSAYLTFQHPAHGQTINLAERSLDRTILIQAMITLIDERIRVALYGWGRTIIPPRS